MKIIFTRNLAFMALFVCLSGISEAGAAPKGKSISNSFAGAVFAVGGNSVVYAWGNNDNMQVSPKNNSKEIVVPTALQSLTNAKEFASGTTFTIMLRDDGKVWSWGSNKFGQLGTGAKQEIQLPEQVQSLDNVIHVAAGEAHAVALKGDGTVWSWGRNGSGQMGDGTKKSTEIPLKVNGISEVTAIATRGDFVVALKRDGSVWAWGDNRNGQLGNGAAKKDGAAPEQVHGITNVIAIAAGGNHVLALRVDGSVWSWGLNSSGQLGDGLNGNVSQSHSLPIPVLWLTDVSAISAGDKYSVAVRRDGTVWAWGDNSYGQLGNGTNADTYSPLQVEVIHSAKYAVCDSATTFVLTSDNLVYSFGDGTLGQLGNGSKMKTNTPIKIVFPGD